MSEKKEKKVTKVTPVGEAKWAHIHTPKPAWKDEHGVERGVPKYQIDVVFSPDDPAWKEWGKHVMDMVRALPDQKDKKTDTVVPKQVPIKKEFDENDQHTGRFYVTFKTSDKFKPGVFDMAGNPIPENVMIGNGSKVRVAYVENTYTAFGGGVNFYLNAVQVVELVEYKKQSAESYGFPVDANAQSIADQFGGKVEKTDDIPW